jgi:hypothetical protein
MHHAFDSDSLLPRPFPDLREKQLGRQLSHHHLVTLAAYHDAYPALSVAGVACLTVAMKE